VTIFLIKRADFFCLHCNSSRKILISFSLRLLHTSDWHTGRTLYGHHRYDEFTAFFDWLHATIVEQQVDILLVAGDIFHTTTPSNRAQQLYYDFLCRVAASSCRHLVVTAGNHDSPTFLSAPRELLRALNIHIIATLPSSPTEEVLVLKNQAGAAEAITCAVPFLRDREIRTATAGQDMDDRERDLIQGLDALFHESPAELFSFF